MLPRRQRYEKRLTELTQARASWEPAWRQITKQLIPYRVMWDRFKRNRGDREEDAILNNTAVRALNTLVAGMMAGITSPARRWFGLTTVDDGLAKSGKVREWLEQAEDRVDSMFLDSNWYSSLTNGVYPDIGSIGQSAAFGEDDGRGRLRYRAMPIGEYYLDQDHEQRIDTCFRRLDLTVRQVVGKFGRDACSEAVKTAYDQGNYDHPVTITHAIQPNDEYDPQRVTTQRAKRYSSCWWDSADPRLDWFLLESGYDEFPVLAPRWSVRPGDVYGRGPGWSVRGDCQVLQHHEKRLMTMVDKTTEPPMKITEGIHRASLLPGDKTYMPEGSGHVFEPAMQVAPEALNAMERHVARDETRIERSFFVDLWQTFLMDDRNERATATEIDAKREERMLMLGPLLENLNDGLLEPAVERNLNIAIRNDLLPPMPDELIGQEMKVKFVSIMHEAQQVPKLAGYRTLIAEATSIAQLRPDVIDKINGDEIIDEIAMISGVKSSAVLTQDQVDAVRQQKAQQAQLQQQQQSALAGSQVAKNLSGVQPQSIADVAGSLVPAAAAQGGALSPA